MPERPMPSVIDADEFAFALSELGDLMRQHELPKPQAIDSGARVGLLLASRADLEAWEAATHPDAGGGRSARGSVRRLGEPERKIVSRRVTPDGVGLLLAAYEEAV